MSLIHVSLPAIASDTPDGMLLDFKRITPDFENKRFKSSGM
jgi:hypothetical protein